MLESSFSRVRFVFLVQGNDWSNVGKLIFKSSIRFLGSEQRLIECWKARFQEFDSFSWFRARTDRMLESSFSRVRFVFLVQGNDWSNVGKLIFKSSIRFLGSGQRLIECWKAHFQEFDSFSWFRATTDRMLESSFSRVRFVFLVQGNDWSNVGKLIFKSLIRFLGSGQRLIERWKAHFQEFDSFSWFKATTDRMLESSFSRVRFVFLVQGKDWSSVGKLIFKSSIRFLGSGQRLQGNDWSSVGKLIFKSSIRFLGSGQRLIECWKARFQEFDSFSWFRATTDRMLESSFSRVRFVFLVQSNDWSNVGKLVFKSSIRFLGSGQRLIECWKAHFQEFDSVFLVQGNDWSSVGKLIFKSSIRFLQSLPWTKKTESNSWKWAFQHSISRCPEPRKRIELLKMSFPTLDQSLPWTKKTNRTLENELSNARWFRATTDRMLESSFSRVRFIYLVQGNDWSNVGKLVFKSSIRFLGSGQRLIECWKAHFQEFDSFSWFRATTDRMLESSFSRVRFVFLVQGNDWSNVGKLVFKSSIRFLGSGQRLIECWKAHFQEFDSFSWFRATTDRALESSFSRVRFVFFSRCPEPRKRIELLKMSFPTFDQSLPWTKKTNRTLENELSNARSVVALNQENESNSWKWAFQRSISRCLEVVALNQENESNSWKRAFQRSISPCPEPRKRIELLKRSFPTLDGSGQRLIECWKAHFQEFDSFSWFRARTDRMLESSFSRVRFVFLVQGNDWSSVGKLVFKSSIRFLQSLPWTKKTNRTLENELSNIRSVLALNQENESNSWKWAFQHSISRCPEPRKRIELLKTSFPTLDQSLPWTKKTNRTLENELSNIWSVVTLDQSLPWTKKTNRTLENWSFQRSMVQGNDWSNVGKLIFKSSIRFLGSGQRLIECWKAHFQEFDSFSSVVALNQENESNSWKWAFQHSISRCPEPRKRIELLKMSFPTFDGSGQRLIERWKAHFQEFDSFSWFRARTDRVENELFNARSVVALKSLPWTKKTNRTLENELSNARSVLALNQENESNSWKWAFQRSISRCPEPRKRIEHLKMSFPTLDGSGQRLIECWKARFQEFDSFSWFRARTDRVLESSFSRVRFVYLVQGNDWSSVGKLIFKSSIRFLGSGQRLIECWKAHFQEFDSFTWFRATTDRMLESSFSRVRFVFLVQGKDWSNVGKLIFKSSIRFLGSGQRLIECWKAHFQEFDSFSWFRARTDRALESSFSRVRFVFLVQGNDFKATTDRALESSFSRVRFVFLVQGNDWSNVGKLIFKSSIRFLGSGQRLIECWKARFQEFDSFSWFRATTDRMLESSFSRVRFVFLVQGNDWSNVGKLIFKSSIRFLGSGQRLIECWKARFQEFDSFSWFRATTDRMLESSFSRVRFVFLLQSNDWSNVGKLVFKSSIRFLGSGNDWSNVGKLVFKSSIRLLGSGQRLIECWKAHFQEFDSFSWFRATTDRMLESSFSRVRFVFLVQGNDWSNVGKLIFKSSIHFLGSEQRLIECWKARFQEFDSFSWFRATTDRMLESSFSRVRFVFLVQGNDWSNVGKLIFKSSIRFLGSGQRLIERWKAHFQEFNSFSWFRATTDRALESSFSRVRFVFLVQGNDWSSVGKLIFKSSIRFLQSLPWTKKTNRTLENELSNARSVVALNQENESNSWKWAFQRSMVQGNDWSSVGKLIFKSSIRFLGSGQGLIELKTSFSTLDHSLPWSRCPEPRKRIELLKTSFPTLDQSLPWTKKTNRTLENELSNARSVVALNQENESNTWKWAFQHSMVQGNDWSNVGKLIFKSSIRLLGSGQRLIECWKAHFQEFDSFSWFRATTDRMLESSFSRVRFVFLVQGNDWSSVGKLIFKSSIRFLGSGQQLIECWKAHFQEFDSFSWFRATTDRMLESSFSRVRFVFLVQGNDWSNVGKLIFKSSIRFLGSGQGLIECWKAHFQEFDSFTWFRATTDRALESSFSRVRFVFLVQGNDWSNVGKLIFKSSIHLLQSLPWTKKTNRTLENELSNARSVVALNQVNESNSWKWAFQHSISRCPEPRKRIELLKTSFPTLDGSGQRLIERWKAHFQEFDLFSWFRATTSRQRLIERWKAHFQEFDSFSWFRATTDRALESSFSRVRFVFLVQGNDWSNVGKLIFKSSIRFLGSGQRLIECWKARFQEFDSFSWFRATTDRMLESSFSRVRFVFLVQGNDWSNVGKLIFKSSIRFLGSGQRLIECWKARFQEFDSFSWFRATTDRMLESSFSRVRFIFLVQSNDWSNVGKLVFKSSIRFLGSGQRLIECWKAHFQEFDSFSWFRATTDRMLESSFSRVRFVFSVQGNDWSSVGKLIFKSSIRFLGSGQRLIERWKAHFQEFDSFSWFRATTDRALESSFSRVRFVFLVQGNDWSSVGKLIFKSSIRLLGSGQRLIECWKARFQEFDSFSWFRATTDRALESSFSRVRFVFLVQGNDWSNVGKLIFKSSIRFLGSEQRLIECWKARFQEFDLFSWFRAMTDRVLESSFSRVRFIYLVQGNDWSNVGKLIFKSSIRFLGSGQQLIERWKAHFQEFDSFSWFRATTDRMLESSFSRVRFVFLVQGNDWSSVGKLIFKSSIRFLGSGQRLIECWKARFQEFDSFSWFRATTSRQRLIEHWKAHFQEFDSFSWFRATTDRALESSFSRVRFVFLVQGNDWSNVGKLVFKSSIRFLGSGQGLIECWKAHFQEFDSFTWFRATTDRALESSFSRVRFVFLVQGNDWSNVGKLIFKSSIHLLQSLPWTKKTNRTLENELSNARSVVALNQVNESNSWKWAFQHSISRCPEPRKRIELLKTSFPTLDGSGQRLIERWKAHFQEFDLFSWFRATTSRQRLIERWKAHFQEFDSFSWFRATTDRALESSFSRVRFVFLVQGNDWSNVGKLIFKSSIRFLGSGQRLIECWKARFQEFDSFSWFRATTDRMLESSFSRVRFVFLVQGNDWSNVGKLIFKSSIRFLGSGQRLIECWKARFQEFDSFSWFRATTDRMLESSFSRVRFVFLVQGNDWSNVGKLVFKSSIRFLQSLPWTKKTNRTLENELSNIRSVVALNQENESNSWKRAFQHSISRCPEPSKRIELLKTIFSTFDGSGQRLIECWKAHFQEFDSFSWFRATTDRMLESSFSRVRFVFLVQGNDWSSVGKLIFKSSIRFLGSGQRLIERWKAHFQEFDSFSWFRARTDRALESSFSRVRFVFLVQGNDWSSVGKLIFKSSIRLLGSGQRLIECWKARFQEFDSFSWFRATTDRALESSFSRVRFVFLVQGNDWSSVGKLIFKSSIHLLGSGQRLIERWKAHFQEFDSFPWFRATTDRMLESSFSRVRFVFLVQGNDWSNVGKLIFKSSIRFLGSGQQLIERWKAHFQEFDSFSWFRATTDRMLESSFSRVRFVFLVQGNDWSSVGKLIFKSSICFLQSLPWTKKTNRTLENELSNIRSVVALNQENKSNSWKWAFQRSISRCPEPRKRIELLKMSFPMLDQSLPWSRCPEPRKRIELLKMSFPTLDQSLPWTKKTNRTLENELSNARSIVALNQENESNSWKWAFQHSMVQGNDWSNVGKLVFKSSIRFLGSGQRLIECWKARFQEFDSFSWFRARTDRMLESSFSRVRFVFLVQATTDRMLESSFSRVRFVFLVQGNDWSNVGKLVFRVRFVFLVQGNDWSNVGKLIFKSSIRFLGSEQRLIECWKARFQEFDSFSSVVAWTKKTNRTLKTSFPTFDQSLPWTKKTNRTLENELSNIRSVVALNQENESNSWKWAFQHSISRCPEPSKRIELLKTIFPTFDGSGQRLIECWKAHFQEFDSFSWFRATTDRMLESSFSRVRFVFLVQGNDWSNVGKLIFKSLIRFLGSGQRLIECWKAHFQEFDSFSWFRATTDRALESSFSRVQFVYLVQGNDWSSVGKLIFKSSIRFLGSGQRLIERWKAHFQSSIRFLQSLPWTEKTNRTLENELSNARSVVALNQENESNSENELSNARWFRATTDRALESSFSRVRFVSWFRARTDRVENELFNARSLVALKSLPWTKKTNRTLENELSNARSVLALNQETNRTLENELSNARSVVALNQENESNTWKWAFQHSMVQGNDWSSVGKLIFKSSIRFLGSGQRLIECWKARFQEFDSFSWFRARTDRVLESSFSRVRFVFLVQGNDWSSVGKLIFKSSIRFLGSGQRLIECWKAHFQEFDSFTWFRATTDRMLESSFSRVRFVFLVQGNDWSNVGKLIFKSSIRFLGSGQRLIERWKAHFQEFDSFSSVVALNQENESNSWKWAFQHSISRCPEPRKRIELLKMSFPTLDQSLPWTKKTNRTLENELSNARSVVALKSLPWTKKTNRTLENELSNARSVLALNQENESNSWKWAFQHLMVQGNDWSNVGKLVFKSSIRFLGSGQRLIECWKAHFQEFDSFSWFRATTDRMLESSFSRVRFIFFSRCPEPRKRIELLKTSFPTFDQSLPWTKKMNRTLENELSNIRSVVALNQENESNSWKWAFQHSISRCPEPSKRIELLKTIFSTFDGSGQRLIECWKAHFQEFDSFSWFRATTDRMLESSFSRVRFVFLVQGNDW